MYSISKDVIQHSNKKDKLHKLLSTLAKDGLTFVNKLPCLKFLQILSVFSNRGDFITLSGMLEILEQAAVLVCFLKRPIVAKNRSPVCTMGTSHIAYATSREAHLRPSGKYLNKLSRDPLDDATYQISRL